MSEIGADVVGPRVACLTEGYLLPFVLSPTMKSQTNAQAEEYESSNQSFLRNDGHNILFCRSKAHF